MNPNFLEAIKRQGALVSLLLLIAYVLYNKIEKMENRIQVCEDQKFEMLADMNKENRLTIERNTKALELNAELFYLITEPQKPQKKKLFGW
jgi:hypothetical protein